MLRIWMKSGLVASQFAYLSAAHLSPDPVEGKTELPSSAQRESERQTRRERIDPKLRAAGWQIVPFDEHAELASYTHHALEEYSTDNGPADYALVVDGQLLGIAEAKKVTRGAHGALTQAERYSRGASSSPLNFRGYHVPFLYSTNGELIFHHDIRDRLNLSRRIAKFHTPDALSELLGQDFAGACSWFAENPNNHPRLRPYQIEANDAIEESITSRKRQMLVAMATGTGKTFTLVNQVYRLMKSGVSQRILFLVDRRALAAQAVRAFASFEPETGLKFNKIYEVYNQRFQREDFGEDEKFDPKMLPQSYLQEPKPGHAFVYISTIQRMTINLFGRGSVLILATRSRSTKTPTKSRSRSTPSTRSSPTNATGATPRPSSPSGGTRSTILTR